MGMAAIVGVGETDYTRGTALSERRLMLDAAILACADAGIAPRDVDGFITTYKPYIDPTEVASIFGSRDMRFHNHIGMGGASATAGVIQAAAAVRAGIAERVVVVCGWKGYSGDIRLGSGDQERLVERPGRPNQSIRRNLEGPYGLIVPMQLFGLQAMRWLHDYPRGQEAMEEVALTMRSHAHHNAKAIMRGRSLTREDYRQAKPIVEPFRLFDICQESDGAAAVLVTAAGASRENASHKPVYVLAGGQGHSEVPDDIANRPDITEFGIGKAAANAFRMTGLKPSDMDFAQIYDCFTFVVLRQLEQIGFCGPREVADFVADGNIGLGGSLPINTHGGLHSQAHIQGMNHMVEAVRQLRGAAGEAQVADAKVGLVTGYGGFCDGSIAILSNEVIS